MHARTATAALLLAAGLLALTGCSSGMSYEEKTDHCAKAIAARSANDTSKPDACSGVKEDDYNTLILGHVITDQGIVDDNGNVDLSKLLTPTP